MSDDADGIEAHGVRRQPTDELLILREAVARLAAQEMASRTMGVALG